MFLMFGFASKMAEENAFRTPTFFRPRHASQRTQQATDHGLPSQPSRSPAGADCAPEFAPLGAEIARAVNERKPIPEAVAPTVVLQGGYG